MQVAELRSKTKEELLEMLDSLKIDYKNAGEDLIKGNEKNLKVQKYLRKDIARVKTILREKEILESIENA
ncbi:MAG: 50S ribosomal protein L29 [Patescibacteria group bacterium]